MCVCVCLSDLSLTVVWVIPGKLNIPVHAQEFASDHECCQPHMVARYLSMYVCVCRHVLVHTNFCFHFFLHFPPPFGHVSRLNTPPAVRLAAVCIEMKSFSQPLFLFLLCIFRASRKCFLRRRCCWWVSFIALTPSTGERAGENREGRIKRAHWMFKQKLANGFVSLHNITHIKVDCARWQLLQCNYKDEQMCMCMCCAFFTIQFFMHFYEIFGHAFVVIFAFDTNFTNDVKIEDEPKRHNELLYKKSLSHTLIVTTVEKGNGNKTKLNKGRQS